ncbi:MAG: sigma-70 family RNA polymerase sigma factor [Pirellulaceae bacterium]
MNSAHPSEPSTSISLLQRVCQGDADGWRRLAQIYGPIVYGWARRCGCQNADAADVMQETFAAVAGAIGRFDYQRSDATFRGWLWTIARNKIRDQARQAGDDVAAGGTNALLQMAAMADNDPASLSESDPPSELLADSAAAQRRACELIRQSFDGRTWRMFWETAVLGREPIAVAEEMQVSKWAVYKARARVLQRLRQEMAGLE